jgi:gamma-glutamyl:cysteine ligase YbdK (ATP-grasp superfamily)
VRSRRELVAAMLQGARPWLATLVALSAIWPILQGLDSEYATARPFSGLLIAGPAI